MFTRERLTRWTKSLRENAHLQGTGQLKNFEGKQCCLGHLCEIEGIPSEINLIKLNYRYIFEREYESCGVLLGKLANDFGSRTGSFKDMNMPILKYNNTKHLSAVGANDAGVPWSVIADHFDKYYPCSDE